MTHIPMPGRPDVKIKLNPFYHQHFMAAQEAREAYHAIERVGYSFKDDPEILKVAQAAAEAIDALRSAIIAGYER